VEAQNIYSKIEGGFSAKVKSKNGNLKKILNEKKRKDLNEKLLRSNVFGEWMSLFGLINSLRHFGVWSDRIFQFHFDYFFKVM